MLIFYVSAGYAYRVNAFRAPDDPEKRDFPLAAVLLGPLVWPLLLLWIIVVNVFVRFVIVPLFIISNSFLLLLQKILQLTVAGLKGRERLKHFFLRGGLVLFILGNFFQLMALLL